MFFIKQTDAVNSFKSLDLKFILIYSDITTYNLVSNFLFKALLLWYIMQSISKVGANNINYSFSNEINIPFVVYIFIFCLPSFVSYSSLLFLEKQSKCKLSLYLFYMSKNISQNIILSNVDCTVWIPYFSSFSWSQCYANISQYPFTFNLLD